MGWGPRTVNDVLEGPNNGKNIHVLDLYSYYVPHIPYAKGRIIMALYFAYI